MVFNVEGFFEGLYETRKCNIHSNKYNIYVYEYNKYDINITYI